MKQYKLLNAYRHILLVIAPIICICYFIAVNNKYNAIDTEDIIIMSLTILTAIALYTIIGYELDDMSNQADTYEHSVE